MRYALIALLILAGCQSMSYSDALGSGYAAVDALARTTEELCASPTIGGDCVGPITTETRDEVRGQLRLALELLDESRQYAVDGSQDIALQRIQQARAILATIERLIEVRHE